MKYIGSLIILFCVCCVTVPRHSTPKSRTQAVQELSAVKIGLFCIDRPDDNASSEKNDESITPWAGSGIIISDRYVLTVAHITLCNDGAQPAGIYIKEQDDRIIPMVVKKIDQHADLALLERADHKSLGIKIPLPTIAAPAEDDIICAVTSYPKKGWLCGKVKNIRRDRIYMSQNVVHGNSGSPVFNISGDLVGITTSLYTCGEDNHACGGGAVTVWNHLDIMP